jgi:hypothetical protein
MIPQTCLMVQADELVGWGRSGLVAEMRPGLLVSGRPFSQLLWGLDPAPCGNAALGLWLQQVSDPLGGSSARVPPTRVPRRLTTGQLIKLLSSFVQPTKSKQNRWLGSGVSDVGTSSWLVTSRICGGSSTLVLDLRIAHDRFGSSSDPSINGHLHYPNDLDRPLSEAAADKIQQYRADYNNRPSNAVSVMPATASTSGRLHSEFVCLLLFRRIGKLNAFLHSLRSSACAI